MNIDDFQNPLNLEDDKEDDKDVRKRKKRTSQAWEHFDEMPTKVAGGEKAKCKYCKTIVSYNAQANGTSSMMGHLKHSCSRFPLRVDLDKNQRILNFSKLSNEEREKVGKSHKIEAHTFNQERLRKKVALMCIKDNMSFSIVQHEGFVELMNEAQPLFKMPSRWTVARDCINIYKEEALKLKECMRSQSVSLNVKTTLSVT